MITCKNCTTDFEGNFCPRCGQSATVHRYNLKHVFHELFHAFTHADKNIFHLFKKILVAPGFLATDLFAGRRKRYFNLFTALLIIATIMVLSDHWTRYFEYLSADQNMRGVMLEAYNWSISHTKITLLLFIPISTLLSWLLFRKQRYNVAEHFVFNSIVMSGFSLVNSLIIHPAFAIFKYRVDTSELITLLFHIVYRTIANRQAFREKWIWTILKTILIYILLIAVFWVIVITGIITARSFSSLIH